MSIHMPMPIHMMPTPMSMHMCRRLSFHMSTHMCARMSVRMPAHMCVHMPFHMSILMPRRVHMSIHRSFAHKL